MENWHPKPLKKPDGQGPKLFDIEKSEEYQVIQHTGVYEQRRQDGTQMTRGGNFISDEVVKSSLAERIKDSKPGKRAILDPDEVVKAFLNS